MSVDRSGRLGPTGHLARYRPFAFAIAPEELIRALVLRRVGRNGWAVMAALCRRVFEDGRLGRSSASEVSEFTGLTAYQVARGMTELRDKGIIVPVIRKDASGKRWADRSTHGHVAQYCISRDIWETVEVSSERQTDGSEG